MEKHSLEVANDQKERTEDSTNERREFLKKAAKFGLYAAPVVLVLFDPRTHALGKKTIEDEMAES